jgi:geranylgeranyl diphosphate synthase type I
VPLTGDLDARTLDLFEDHLRAFLQTQATRDPIARQLAYHFALADRGERRGKRLRPRLVIASAASYGAKPQRTLSACVAVELLHNYSLIHDDIEDGDRLRHGRQTLWAAFGVEHGINAGDAVGALAQMALTEVADSHGAEAAFEMSMELARALFCTCVGQAQDLALAAAPAATLEQYTEMISGKTASLFACAAALGARCASADEAEVERSREVGRLFGMGFQIHDDVLGIWGSTQATGKSQDRDLARRKKSFPVVWALERGGDAVTALERAYTAQAEADATAVDGLRHILEACGAHEAARSAADTYFNEALVCARGDEPLSDFVMQNRM